MKHDNVYLLNYFINVTVYNKVGLDVSSPCRVGSWYV